jgi:iron complex transport system substrate-binding protein
MFNIRICRFVCWLVIASCFFSGCKTSTSIDTIVNIREVTDDSNRRVQLPQKVERAISLAPNLTESVFAIDAGERLIGITEYCNFPADETKKIQKVGDTIKPNIETILALKPQVILVSTASQLENFTKQLEENNIAVFITNPTDLEGVFRNLTQMGEIFGKTERASEVVSQLRKRVASVESKTNATKDLKVFVQISREPLYTIGKASFLNDLINRAGGISVTESITEAFPKLSKETALASNPDAIILSESPDNLEANDVFKDSPASKNKRIFKLNADIISRPGPRLVDALEIIAKDLHPEAFQ